MRARLICLLCLVLMPLAISASDNSKDGIIAGIVKSGANLESMDCVFTQTRHSGLLDGNIVTEGRMCYVRPDRLRWEYKGTMPFAFVLNGNKVKIVTDGQGGVSGGQNKMFREIARMILGTISGSSLTDTGLFETSIDENGNNWIVTLVPVRKDMRQMWTNIILTFNREKDSVVEVGLYEVTGDYTIIRFDSIVKNTAIDDSLFSVD